MSIGQKAFLMRNSVNNKLECLNPEALMKGVSDKVTKRIYPVKKFQTTANFQMNASGY
jgi:hypothetical protein